MTTTNPAAPAIDAEVQRPVPVRQRQEVQALPQERRTAASRIRPGRVTPMRTVPPHIGRPPYADTGEVAAGTGQRHPDRRDHRAHAHRRPHRRRRPPARRHPGTPGITTEELDVIAHEACIERGAYPSPLNYHGYPKAICTSVNEVICHGIPDDRPPQRRRHREPRRHRLHRRRPRRHQRHVRGRTDSSTTSASGSSASPANAWSAPSRGAPRPPAQRHRQGDPAARRGQRVRRRARLHRPRHRRAVPHRPADPPLLRAPQLTSRSRSA